MAALLILGTVLVPIATAELSVAAERQSTVTQDGMQTDVVTERHGSEGPVLSGVADAAGNVAPRWHSTEFQAQDSGIHVFQLAWSGDAMLRIDIRELATDEWVGSNTSTAQPKTMSVSLSAGARYRVAVWSMTGVGTFDVRVERPSVTSTTSTSTTTTSTTTTSTTTTSTTTTTTAPVPAGDSTVFAGSVDASRSTAPRWMSVDYTPAVSTEHAFELTWSGGASLRIDLRDAATGAWIAADTSSAQPKSLVAPLVAGARYQIAVWSMSGRADFAVTVSTGTTSPPPPTTTTTTTTTTTAAPPATTTTTTTTTTTVPPPAISGSYAGEPANGTLYWGAAVGGNDDPARHEDPAGHVLTVRRTFFQWKHRTGYMVDTARADLAAGRLPWVSTKTPSWAAMAAGDHDAAIDEMLRALDALDGPVWLTIHHEPEGGGGVNAPDDPAGPAGHVAMNRRVRERMTVLGTDNIALAPILMSWTWDPRSGRNASEWWAPGIYDFLGVDHYEEQEATLVTDVWYDVRSFAAARGVDVAVGEWGMRGTDAAAGERVRQWFDHAAGSYADGGGARVVGLAAFDSHLNAPSGSWELEGEQLRVFHELLFDPRTAAI